MTIAQGIWLTAAILLLIRIGFIIAGTYLYYCYTAGKKKKCSAQTTGTVIDQYFDGNNKIQPIIEYTVDRKIAHTFKI